MITLPGLEARVRLEWLALGIVLAVLALLPFVSDTDPDFWWHLRTGDLIAHTGIPRHDSYSWTAGGRPWVAHEWLSELLIYEVQHWLGYAADVALFSGAAVASLALMYTLARRRGARAEVALGLLVLSSINIALFITVRPQVLTWLLFAVFVAVIDRTEHGESAPVWLLPPLMAVWVNLHLGFTYGLAVAGLWCVARGYRRMRGQQVDLRTPVLITAACILAAMLNPVGPAIFLYPLRYLADGQATAAVSSEWERPSLTFAPLWPYFLSVALILGALASKRRPPPFLFLVALAATAASLEAARNIAFAALMLPAAAGPALTALVSQPRSPQSRAQRRRRGRPPAPQPELVPVPATLPLGVAGSIMLAILGFGLLLIALSPGGVPLRTPRERSFPSDGAAYVSRELPNAQLFNEYTWGGFLIDYAPSIPVFVDGRSDFYRARILNDYTTINRTEDGWEDVIARYQIDTMLIPKNARLAAALRRRANWQEVFTGEIESVFVRRA